VSDRIEAYTSEDSIDIGRPSNSRILDPRIAKAVGSGSSDSTAASVTRWLSEIGHERPLGRAPKIVDNSPNASSPL